MADEHGTLDRLYWPLMRSPSIKLDHCAICGRPAPLEQHHMVFRSAGELYVNGVRRPHPCITVCGFGNCLQDADGRYYCHGLAHHRMLHFRWVDAKPLPPGTYNNPPQCGGHLEYLITKEPTKYADALEMDGWRRVNTRRKSWE